MPLNKETIANYFISGHLIENVIWTQMNWIKPEKEKKNKKQQKRKRTVCIWKKWRNSEIVEGEEKGN